MINYIKKGELIFLEDYIALTCPVCKTCRNDLFYINKPAFYIKKDEEKVLAIKEKVKEKIDIQIFHTAIKEYMKSKSKNLTHLMQYARILRIEDKVRLYTEVMLWLNQQGS